MIRKMRFLGWRCAWAAIAICLSSAGAAQTWPAKSIRVLVPFPPGTAPDIVARLVGDKLARAWAQPVVIENRPGAGGITAMSMFVRTPADGYTLAFVPASTVTLTPHLFRDPQFNVDRDIVAVATAGTGPMMIAVHPASGITSLAELIALAKAQPGKVNFASPGVNSVPFLTGDMIDRQAGIKLYSVPYAGSTPAITAAVTGEATVVIDGLPPLVAQVKAGKLRAIAVTSRERLPGFESIPPAADTLPGFEAIGWFAIFAPSGTPAAVIERVNGDVNTVMQMPDVVARLADLGIYPNPGAPKAVDEFVRAQRVHWKKVIDTVGVQPQ